MDVVGAGVIVADAGPFAGAEDVLVAFDDTEPGSLRYVEAGEVLSPY